MAPIDLRVVRACKMITEGKAPKPIDNRTYLVPSQGGLSGYKVTKGDTEWQCECPDHISRGIKCKHIYAVMIWQKLREEVLSSSISMKVFRCRFCWSEKVVRYGVRHNRSGKKQVYKCKSCGKYFSLVNDEFKWIRGSAKDIALILDLYFKGLSLRKIVDHLRQFYGIKLHASTVYRRIQKYVALLNEYAQAIAPQIGDKWHVDEMMIKCSGKWHWLWNAVDSETRFLLASIISRGRSADDAKRIFLEAKKTARGKPATVVTDGLPSYIEAWRKEFYTRRKPRTEHVRLARFEDKVNNNNIERLHGTLRERNKVMRGFNGNQTAQALLDGLRVYYNFVRPHMGIGNNTPAQAAKIDLKLDENRWLSLLRKAAKHKNSNNHPS